MKLLDLNLSTQQINMYADYVANMLVSALIKAIPLTYIWNTVIIRVIPIIKEIEYLELFSLIIAFNILTRTWLKDNANMLGLQQASILANINNLLWDTNLKITKNDQNLSNKDVDSDIKL